MINHVIITGKTGYLSTSLSDYLTVHGVSNELVSVRDKELPDLSGVSVVVHLAGIVHVKATKEEYYKVNTELTLKLAEKAKAESVKQFIFMSSASVYESGFSTEILRETPVKALNDYAKSKLSAEKKIRALSDDTFSVAIVRLPMVYGPQCTGNFSRLYRLAEKLPFFPYVENKRTMLFIDNFTEFIRLLINCGKGGLFFPQNREYVNTSVMYADIRRNFDKQTFFLKLTGKLLTLIGSRIRFNLITKLFGSLTYDKAMSDHFDFSYCITSYSDSIAKTCRGNQI